MSKEKKLQIGNSTAEFLVFTRQAGEDGIEVRVAEETVWLTQKLIGVLFDKGRSTITEHLKNIFGMGELDEKAVCRDFRHTAEDGKDYTTRFYNLDAIIAVGFRVNSARAVQFRQWARGERTVKMVRRCRGGEPQFALCPSLENSRRMRPTVRVMNSNRMKREKRFQMNTRAVR